MLSNGRNSGFGSPNNNDQNRLLFNNRMHVMCRLCDRMLYNTQALITHIESHIVEGAFTPVEPNQYHQSLIQANNQLFVPNPNSGPRLAPQSSPFSHFSPSREAVAQRPIPTPGPGLSLSLGRDSSGGPQPVNANHSQAPIVPQRVSPKNPRANGSKVLGKRPIWMVEDVVSPVDGTRPFINQLDRPIPKVVDLEVEYEHGLDLTLKL